MAHLERNSMVRAGVGSATIEQGRVINVHQRQWTVDARTTYTGREMLELQVMNPYFHFHSGEGIYPMPEINANVIICGPGDSPPFVMGFMGAFETEEGGDTHRGGRPQNAKPGDLIMRGRDGNQIWLHRGGVLELGSETMPRSFYIPLTNLIRDMTLRYELMTGGGLLAWDVEDLDETADDHPASVLTLLAHDKADDDKGSVRVRIGHASDEDRLELVVAPQGVDKDGTPSGQVYRYVINNDGDVTAETAGDVYFQVDGDTELSLSGGLTLGVRSSADINVGSSAGLDIGSDFSLSASRLVARVSGSMLFDSPNVQLGGSGGRSVVVANSAFAALLRHTHPVTGAVTGVMTNGPLPASSMTARRVTAK